MLKAIPTICLLLILHWYFKAMLFGPLDKVLKQRDELTEGARKSAEQSLAAAERKQQEYEKKFNEARAELYRAQEETRRKWLEDQAAQVDAARQRSAQILHEAKQQIESEAATARESLTATTAGLADEIANSILARKSGSRT
ncbi:MAG TPA: ATP synthase F0 subunit B [Bryobacteraceae bacterium]|jgi:F-type H+-transporting ATPase subunit b|nr:ATP synthase F0 subunit B [Bryobacteraceae bacterium]